MAMVPGAAGKEDRLAVLYGGNENSDAVLSVSIQLGVGGGGGQGLGVHLKCTPSCCFFFFA